MPELSQSETSQRGSMAPSRSTGVRLPSPKHASVRGGNSGNENTSTSSLGGNLASSSSSSLTQRKNRLNTVKYYDIASTILAGGPDLDELFLAAAKDGDFDKIEHFLQGRSDVIICIDTKDKRTGNTPLIWAAKKAHTKIVQLLLKHGADPTLRNYEGQTAVEVAPPGIKTILLDSVEKTTESSHRLLLQAAWQGNIKVVRKLLKENKVLDINCQNAEGLTPLLLATRDIQLFERLSLQLNRSYNPAEVIQELLTNRANIHAIDGDEKTCLHYASNSRATVAQSLVDVLIREGSELELRDRRHFMPIHWASHSGNTKVVVALIDGGSEVNSRGFAGLTSLHITAHNDHQKTAVALLEHGADVTVTDDRGLTAVDLAKSRRMKMTLREAWTEQTQKKQTTTLAPVRAPSREESRLQMEESGRRRKGEVIFDGLVTTPLPSQTGPASRPSFSRSISNADKARLAEQQMNRDLESGRFTPNIKENTRRLGTLRGSLKPTTLPRVGTSSSGTPSSPDRLSPESPSGRKSSMGDPDVRLSLDDGRGQLGIRRSKSLKLSQAASERRRITPLSTREGTQEDFCVQNNRVSPVPHEVNQRGRTHRRTGSDPFLPPRIGDVAMSCDNYLPHRGRSLSNSEEYDLDERMRMTPLRTPLDREMTGLNIPTTIPEVLTPRSITSTVVVNIETKRQSSTPPQLISLYPNSSNVLPPTPTFITQKSYSILDAKLVSCGKAGDSSNECSPRSDEDLPKTKDQVRLALSNPTELLRSRSLLKEEFVLDESRPKDPLLQSSGSDPTSSASSLSSSPRDNTVNILILSKVGKSAKEYHSPLSKVGRYSISGPNNNVGEKFRNKVGRSRSFSSGPCVGESREKLSGVKFVGGSSKKSAQKQNSLDSVQLIQESEVAGKESSESAVDLNMNKGSVMCMNTNNKKDIPSATAKTESSQPNAASSASTQPLQTHVKQSSGQSATTSQTMKKSQSSPGALNVPKIVRNVKTPLQNNSKVNTTSSTQKGNSANSSKKLSGAKDLVSTFHSSYVTHSGTGSTETVSVQASSSSSSTNVTKSEVNFTKTKEETTSTSLSNSVKTSAESTVTVSKSRPTLYGPAQQATVPSSALQPKPSTQKPNITSSKPASSANPVSASSTAVSLSKVSVKLSDASPAQTPPTSASRICASESKEAVPSTPHQSKPTSARQNVKVSFSSQTKPSSGSKNTLNVLTPAKVPKSDSPTKSLRSPSDSQLGNRPSSKQKSNPARKSDTWKYVKPCQENKEPLVRISLPGEEPKPHICEPRGIGSHVVMQTPVIVNPFENWLQPEIMISPRTLNEENARSQNPKGVTATTFGYVIGKSSKDATCKVRKTRNVKSAKKTKDGKRPVSSGQRQSSGRRRGARSQDSKACEQTENTGRVKSGKSGRRLKSGKKRKKDLETEALRVNASKPDVALISGIGWHVATGCNDTSDVKVADLLYSSESDDSDIEVIDPDAPKFKLLSARTEGTVSPSTPRFQEIKGGNEGKLPLPVMTHDGFPPMNLDMTQKVPPAVKVTEPSFYEERDPDDEDYSNHLNDVTNALHKEIMLGKLTPIPETPSVSHSVQAAIHRFDQTVKDEQLNKMLGFIPGESLSSQQAEVIRQTKQEGGSADSRLRKSGSLRKEVLTHESAKIRAKVAANKADITPGLVSGKKNPPTKSASRAKTNNNSSKNSASSLKGSKETLTAVSAEPKGRLSAKKDQTTDDFNDYDEVCNNTGRERKFSESKKEDEEIDEAIEEILNATGNSLSSTLRSNNTVRSPNSTLTEGDRHVLMRLQNNDSMFHAKTSDQEDGRQSDSYANDTNPNLLRVFHAENFNLGSKVKAMIDAGAEPSKVKAMLDADEEAKQLAKVMNSFCHMELHAGGTGGSVRLSKDTPRKHSTVPRPEASMEGPLMTHKPPSGRPSSAGGRHKGKFHEMKSVTPRNPQVETSIVQEELAVLEKLSAAVGEITDPNALLTNPSDGETLCSRLSGRRGSKTGSACTDDSLSSIVEETIQWKKGNVLGKGAFGTVWCGLTNEGELIAVKQIDLNTTDMDKAHREYEKVQEEVELLKNLRHKNIVGYMGTSFEDYTVSIFMQFVPGGSIASILARFGALEESVFRRYTRQILEGVEYLHDNDVIHRDIKGGNVMLMPTGIIKLIDFGCAKRLCINLSMSQSQILKSMKGTPYWMAPEVVNETGHGKKSDIWSIGCTVFEMATRKPPWSNMNPMAAIFAIGSDKPVPTLPSDNFTLEAQTFVNKCLTRDQNVRPSATELLQDPFILKKSTKK